MDILSSLITGVVAGAFSGGMVWGAVRTELKYMRRDITELRKKVFPWGVTTE